MKHNHAVVLLSGGIDSATCLYYAHRRYSVTALVFDYAQRHIREIQSAVALAGRLNIPHRIIPIDLRWVSSALTNRRIRVPHGRELGKKEIPITYVPGRNIIFLSYAVSFADNADCRHIFIGAHTQDYSGYPDCRPEFLNAFENAANLGIKNTVSIHAPFLLKNKVQIIKTGLRLKVPFELTWSCYEGKSKPCLVCDSCRFRIEGFRRLGLEDPLLKRKS